MSYPHFYLADEQRAMFDGLEPVVEDHKTFFDVEPNTGMTLKIHTRIQVLSFGIWKQYNSLILAKYTIV